MPGLDDIHEALSDMIDLAQSWASCGPEGFTPDEKKRVREAEKALTKLRRLQQLLG